MSDEMPDWVAMIDQARRMQADIAKVIRAYYEGLIAEGFDVGQAMVLTLAFQQQVMGGGA